jgi:gamma-glutamyl:cysteine ligase YbdK (ATP-grasp superfamily)
MPSLFEVFGVEIELMIVARDDLRVLPICDRLLSAAAGGAVTGEHESGGVTWSNELALHVVELKTTAPARALPPLVPLFQSSVREIDALLTPMGASLLPSGMHPFMVPDRDLRLWPHDYGEVYAAFDRVFSCRGHGWANLQSVHLNLPFAGDAEFARLHAAVRHLLPILPALAASSPFREGERTGFRDTRLETYRKNARAVPSVSGLVVPEPVESKAEYEASILGRIYADLAPLDPEGVLRHEWVNARGAIARFDRDTIEVRVIDSQEGPAADVAVAAAAAAAARLLAEGAHADPLSLRALETGRLAAIFLDAVRNAEDAVIADAAYLAPLGVKRAPIRMGELWEGLVERTLARDGASAAPLLEPLRRIFRQGPLATRLLRRAGGGGREAIAAAYADLARCLAEGRGFDAPP